MICHASDFIPQVFTATSHDLFVGYFEDDLVQGSHEEVVLVDEGVGNVWVVFD